MHHADVAQLVERDLAKVEVAGSSPVVRSKGLSQFLKSEPMWNTDHREGTENSEVDPKCLRVDHDSSPVFCVWELLEFPGSF